MSVASSQCCLQHEVEGEVLAKSRYLRCSIVSYLTRFHLAFVFAWCCLYTQYTSVPLAHEQGHCDNNSNHILLLLILIEYLLCVFMIRNWPSQFGYYGL